MVIIMPWLLKMNSWEEAKWDKDHKECFIRSNEFNVIDRIDKDRIDKKEKIDIKIIMKIFS